MIYTSFWDLPSGENYNYFLELCSLLFLIGLTLRHFIRKKFPSPTNKVYGMALICAILDLALDIAGCITIQYANDVPVLVNEIINGCFYFFQILFPGLLVTYIIYQSGHTFKDKWTIALLVPAALFFCVLASNAGTHWIFSFGPDASGNIVMNHELLFPLFYGVAAFYVLAAFVLTLVFRKRLSHRQKFVLLTAFGVIVIALGLQSFFPKVLLTGTAITMSMMLTSITIINPDEMIDKFTGVFNFNALIEYLNTERFEKQYKFYVMVRINNLAEINETFGGLAFNEISRKVGLFFNSFGKDVYVFTTRTSKFICCCKDWKTQDDVTTGVQKRFAKPFSTLDKKVDLNVSMFYFENKGIFKTGEGYIKFIEEIGEPCDIEESDFVELNDDFMNGVYRTRKIKQMIRDALENNGFSMVYQPIFDIQKKRYNHFEALIRLNNEEIGYVGPAEFIPIAERAGLAPDIDFWVLRETCQFLKRHPEIEVLEINVSCAEFFNNPSDQFLKIIDDANVDPARICIELTETVASKYPEKSVQFMNDLAERGVTFAIDDFGTGYSNVARIVKMPFSLTKLDKSLLSGEDRVEIFLKSAVSLFRYLDMPIVIEGVETIEQLKVAQRYGINFIQGYYFSKPLPENELIALIKKKIK